MCVLTHVHNNHTSFPSAPCQQKATTFKTLGNVWLGGENEKDESNSNFTFIFIVWLHKIYKNLISNRI